MAIPATYKQVFMDSFEQMVVEYAMFAAGASEVVAAALREHEDSFLSCATCNYNPPLSPPGTTTALVVPCVKESRRTPEPMVGVAMGRISDIMDVPFPKPPVPFPAAGQRPKGDPFGIAPSIQMPLVQYYLGVSITAYTLTITCTCPYSPD